MLKQCWSALTTPELQTANCSSKHQHMWEVRRNIQQHQNESAEISSSHKRTASSTPASYKATTNGTCSSSCAPCAVSCTTEAVFDSRLRCINQDPLAGPEHCPAPWNSNCHCNSTCLIRKKSSGAVSGSLANKQILQTSQCCLHSWWALLKRPSLNTGTYEQLLNPSTNKQTAWKSLDHTCSLFEV